MEKYVFQWRNPPNGPKVQNGVIETHIPPSDQNIFSKKKYGAISPWVAAHVGERIFLLSAIPRSNRQNATILSGIIFWCHFGVASLKRIFWYRIEIFFRKKSMWRYLHEQAHMFVKGFCCKVPFGGVIGKMPRFCPEFWVLQVVARSAGWLISIDSDWFRLEKRR